MPRDDKPPLAAEAESYKTPLKRGDACLYCRKRRIRCSATKPSCQHCAKLKRECVYDTGKPVSRVKQLEDKVAELEEMLKTGLPDVNTLSGTASRGGGAGGSGPPPLFHHSSSDATSTSTDTQGGRAGAEGYEPSSSQGDGMIDVNMLNMFPSGGNADTAYFPSFGAFVLSPQPGGSSFHPQAATNNQHPVEELFDFSILDPNFMSLLSNFSSTTTGPLDPNPNPNPNSASANVHQSDAPLPTHASQQVNMDFEYTGPSGLTPFLETPLNPSSLSGFSPATSSSTSQPSYPNSMSGQSFPTQPGGSLSTPPTSVPQSTRSLSQPAASLSTPPTAVQTSTGLSYQAYVSDPSADTFSNTNMTSSTFTAPAVAPVVHNVLGVHQTHPSAPSLSTTTTALPQSGLGDASGYGWKDAETMEQMPLVGGWFDAADLPHVARDHLLDLFFSRMRMFGQEFHVPRFRASLTLPVAKRPHPCLLYSMYLLASRISTTPHIRNLEIHFYSIASKQLEESISKADRLLDAIRAASILAVYKYSMARYHEGWMMIGQAARLAISCGLHQIASSQFKPSTVPKDHRADLVGVMRQREFVLPPPQDPIELAERIMAFWAIFIIDRCGAISTQWPPAIPDSAISTPYPRPLDEYELGLINRNDDDSISSLWDSGPRTTLPHYSDSTAAILRLRALAILERASKLMYLKPEPGWEEKLRSSSSASPSSSMTGASPTQGEIDEYLSTENSVAMCMHGPGMWGPGPPPAPELGKGHGWTRTARIRTPKAFEEVRQALLRVEEDLPPERRTKWEVWDGIVQDWHFAALKKDTYTLHFVLGCAWMFLFDVFSFGAVNERSVNVARRLAFTVRAISREDLLGELDVFLAMCWSFIVKILIRELKRLQAIGDIAATQPLEHDIDAIVTALKLSGQRHSIGSMQALRADRYRKSTFEDMKWMEGDHLDEEHLGFRSLEGEE